MELEFSEYIFEKYSNTKFHENTCSGSRVVSCGRRNGRTDDMTKLIFAFRNLANAPKIDIRVNFKADVFNLYWQKATTIIVEWLAGPTSKNQNVAYFNSYVCVL
jgi:hypothetical protein